MPEAFAICTLHVCRKPAHLTSTARPEIEVVPAGSIFDAEQKDIDWFISQGAARPVTPKDRLFAQLAAEEQDELSAIDVVTASTGSPVARRAGAAL